MAQSNNNRIDISRDAEKKFLAYVERLEGNGIAFRDADIVLPKNVEVYDVVADKQPTYSKLNGEYSFVLGVGSMFAINFAKYFAKIRNLPLYVVATTPFVISAFDNYSFVYSGGIYKQTAGAVPSYFAMDTKRGATFSKEEVIQGYLIALSFSQDVFEKYFRHEMFGTDFDPSVNDVVDSINKDILAGMEVYRSNGATLRYFRLMNSILEARSKQNLTCLSLELASSQMTIAKLRKIPCDFYEVWCNATVKSMGVIAGFLSVIIRDNKSPDMDLRMQYLTSVLGKSESVALKILGDGISANSYAFLLKRYAQKRYVFHDAIVNMKDCTNRVLVEARKLGGKDSYFDVDLFKEALALCPELYYDIGVFTVMKFLGVFDSIFMEII